jgi:hypothetical protein
MFTEAIGTNLDQLQNGTITKTPEWSNGSINNQNSCYSEGDVVPYRYFVTGVGPGELHFFTINFEFTKGGKKAFDYLAKFDITEAGPITTTGGTCGSISTTPPADCATPVLVATFPDPTIPPIPPFFAGYGGEALPCVSFCLQPGIVTLGGYTFTGSLTADSELSILVAFTTPATLPANSSVGFFWGGHLAKGTPTTWGIGNGAGSVSGAPFHMRGINLDGGGQANQDRSIQSGSVCLPPQAMITLDVPGPYCPGSTHTASAPAGAGSYLWTVTGGTITSGQGTNSITYTVTANCGGSVTVSVKACNPGSGCTTDACCNTDTETIPVDDTTPPTVVSCLANQTIECPATPRLAPRPSQIIATRI